MRIEKRLISKIATHTPRKTVQDTSGKTVLVLPEGEIQWYITYEDGERVRAYFLWIEYIHNLILVSYTPLDNTTQGFHSRDGIVAVASHEVEYEEY